VAPRLLIDDGRSRREIALGDGVLRVGRGAAGNDVRLEERNVSRHHARFSCRDGAVEVEDLGSRLGTFVNGERLAGPRLLAPGDRVRIGDFELELARGPTEPAAAPGPPPPGGHPPPLPNRFTPRPSPPAEPDGPSALRRAVEAVVGKVTRK
jgi:predicted component of type VI protein secretion system